MPITTREAFDITSKYVGDSPVVAALGRTSEVAFALFPNQTLFLDSMTEVASIALGVAISIGPTVPIFAFDTDGGQLMGLYLLPTLAAHKNQVPNLTVLVLDNELYEAAGGAASRYSKLDWRQLGIAFGLRVQVAHDEAELDAALSDSGRADELSYIVVKILNADPLAPTQKTLDGIESKYRFVRHLEKLTGHQILLPAEKS